MGVWVGRDGVRDDMKTLGCERRYVLPLVEHDEARMQSIHALELIK